MGLSGCDLRMNVGISDLRMELNQGYLVRGSHLAAFSVLSAQKLQATSGGRLTLKYSPSSPSKIAGL